MGPRNRPPNSGGSRCTPAPALKQAGAGVKVIVNSSSSTHHTEPGADPQLKRLDPKTPGSIPLPLAGPAPSWTTTRPAPPKIPLGQSPSPRFTEHQLTT